ncbi:hypothetical protein JW964_05340, partial [candidate division KSB1 bacterium]|nr:hypothetical protein [candidate division KSB1 bacterium]
KVSLENGPIEHGDLLTTSSIPGYAMKATDPEKSFQSIVGKALQSFDGKEKGQNTSFIMVLVTM